MDLVISLICLVITVYIIKTCFCKQKKERTLKSLDQNLRTPTSMDHCAMWLILYKLTETSPIRKPPGAQALINFVYKDDIYGKDGIIEGAGDAVKQEYDEKRLLHEHVSRGVIETSCGKLPVQAIFHVMVSPLPGKFENMMRTTLRLAYSKGLRDVVASAVPCLYPHNTNIKKQYPHLPPANPKYREEGRLVIVAAENVEGIEYFRSNFNTWLVYPRSGKATRATQGWRKDIFRNYLSKNYINKTDMKTAKIEQWVQIVFQ